MRDDPINALGGVRPTARTLGIPISTVAGWRRNGIPAWRWPQIEHALRTVEDFSDTGRETLR